MKLTWLGHSCFVLEHDDYRIVMDPYKGVPGYPTLKVQANEVYCSHTHADHHAIELVTRLPPRKNPFKVREVRTFHDEQEGAERGGNIIHIFSANDITVAHMGDLGHHLTLEQIEAIGPLTVMLVPVGGVYTIDAIGAKSACMALRPRCVVPMHYRHAPYGLPNIGDLDAFLKLWPKTSVHRLDGPVLDLTTDLSGVYVPRFDG
ncbi:MAG: MBL fold metallo-hydrolase [Oscillibacter sp.]|nr:MBL fold metallo-hydrolase [Oscillibacter sp.]